ncbi:type IX secretion system ring subunit PorN/GldN [Candidatus Amoebophilus asiaticus]|nr:gliding motility protein GldN [Candidatus Amoebophilus asiaticus]
MSIMKKLFSRLPITLIGVICLHTSLSVVFAQTNNSEERSTLSDNPTLQTKVDEVQTQEDNPYLQYNENSVIPISEADILFRRRIWREIYLKERKNKPFFARNREITKFIIQGVKEGILIPYKDESLNEKMTKEQFLENLSLPKEEDLSAQEKALGFTEDNGWGDKKAPADKKAVKDKHVDEFLPNEITTLELMEDIIFHKRESTFIYDIQTIKLIIPAEKFPTGLRKTVGTFKYKDLAAYFDSKPKEALWVNVKNNAGNKKLTDAIQLRLFDSRIVKVEDPDDRTVEDIYSKTPKDHLYASQKLEEDLIELEQFIWEY